MEYITADELLVRFGAAWATPEQYSEYADLTNAWLMGAGLSSPSSYNAEDTVIYKKASFFLARAAKEGQLFVDSDGIKSQKVSADTGTSVETSYFAYQSAENRWVKAAKGMIGSLITYSAVSVIHKIN